MLVGTELQDVPVGLKHGWLCDVCFFFFYRSCVDSCLDYCICSCFHRLFCRIISSGCLGKGSGLQEGISPRSLLDPCFASSLCCFLASLSLASLRPADWITLLWVSCPGWVCSVRRGLLLPVGRTQLRSNFPFISLIASLLEAPGSAGLLYHISTDINDKYV